MTKHALFVCKSCSFSLTQRLFEALPDAHLEIHTSEIATAILTDKIKCEFLELHEAVAIF